jgi:hypothetical protein
MKEKNKKGKYIYSAKRKITNIAGGQATGIKGYFLVLSLLKRLLFPAPPLLSSKPRGSQDLLE